MIIFSQRWLATSLHIFINVSPSVAEFLCFVKKIKMAAELKWDDVQSTGTRGCQTVPCGADECHCGTRVAPVLLTVYDHHYCHRDDMGWHCSVSADANTHRGRLESQSDAESSCCKELPALTSVQATSCFAVSLRWQKPSRQDRCPPVLLVLPIVSRATTGVSCFIRPPGTVVPVCLRLFLISVQALKTCTRILMPASRHVTLTSFVRLLPLAPNLLALIRWIFGPIFTFIC